MYSKRIKGGKQRDLAKIRNTNNFIKQSHATDKTRFYHKKVLQHIHYKVQNMCPNSLV